jgi:hypothetical protein
MMANDPIPDDFRDAFTQAVANFTEWTGGGPEPEVSLKKQSVPARIVFNFTESFSDRVPDDIYNYVRDLAQGFRDCDHGFGHDCAGPKDQTYKGVAQCMLRLYWARAAYYRREESKRRSRGF